MTLDQRNKAYAWYRRLTPDVRGIVCCYKVNICFNFFFFFNICYLNLFLFIALVVELSKHESSKIAEEATSANNNTTKDDVARLIHLFKEPAAKIHWSNHYGTLNRAQLDAR